MEYGAIAVIAKTKKYIRIFRKAGADSPQRSINPHEHGINKGFVFRKLERQGVFVRENNEKYYLDENKYARIRKIKLTVVTFIFSLILLIIAISYLVCRN